MTATAHPTVSVCWIRIVALKDLFLHNLLIIHTKQKSKTQRRSWNHKNWFIIGFSRHEIYFPNRKHKKTPLPCSGLSKHHQFQSVKSELQATQDAWKNFSALALSIFITGRVMADICWLVFSAIFFDFHPENWGRFSFWLIFFSDGLVQPPTSLPGSRWYQHLPFGVPSLNLKKHGELTSL